MYFFWGEGVHVRSKNTFWESVLSFYHVDSRDPTQAIKPSKDPFPLSTTVFVKAGAMAEYLGSGKSGRSLVLLSYITSSRSA